MSTAISLTAGRCEALRLQVPVGAPEFVVGTHGLLWQWIGDGVTLVTVTLTSRRSSHLTAPENLRDRLRHELDQLASAASGEIRRGEPDAVAEIAGGTGIVTGSVTGHQYGVPMSTSVTVTSDGRDLYALEVRAADSDAGRSLAADIISSIRISEKEAE